MITPEDFDKLKQSDRIEFLLRKTRLEKRYEWYNPFNSFFVIFFMSILLFIFIGLFVLAKTLTLLLLGYMVFITLMNILNQVLEVKKSEELESKFFKKEVKPKR